MGFIAYNAIMALQLVAVLYIQRYSRHPAPIRSTAGFTMAALGIGALLGLNLYPSEYEDHTFAMMNMWSHGLFGHLPVLLIGQAWLLRRRKRTFAAGLFAALAMANVALAVDMFLVEPHDLQVRQVTVKSSKLTRRYRIAIVADLQTDKPGEYERSALIRAMEQSPDFILMPGDYVQGIDLPQQAAAERALNAIMRDIQFAAPLGVHAVQGNVDSGGDWPAIFRGVNVSTYVPTTTVAVGKDIQLTALSFDDSFDTQLVVPASDRFHIAVGHGPDFALGKVEADLLVAGHTHGGQVQLPGIGPLVTFSRIPNQWADGVTELSGGRTLVVSRGVGMERDYAPRIRFFCRPEIVVVDLVPLI
ncbi:MAG: metallophosphoesterase [Myxococcota bacterium]